MKMKFFVLLTLLIVAVMVLGACGPADAPPEKPVAEEPAAEEPAAEEPAVEEPAMEEPTYVEIAGQKIEPLDEPIDLTFSTVGASIHALPLYVAREKGWLDELGINLEHISFDNGPIQMEALGANSWDFGTTGQGGIFTGVLAYDTQILADLVSDDDMMRLVVRSDHPLAQAGAGNLEEYPELYGTAEDWEGVEIMTPQGTIPHFVTTKVLDKFGLTEDDVEMANMSQANAFTALTAGQGELASLMGSFAYRLEGDEDYTFVGSSNAIGGGFAIAMMVVPPEVFEDPVKMEAITKALDVHFAVVDYFDTISIEEVTEWQVAMSEEKGLSSNWDELFQYMNGTVIYPFDHSYDLQTTVSDDGELTLIERSIVDPLKFFIDLDKFAPEDAEKMSSGYFPTEYMESVLEARE